MPVRAICREHATSSFRSSSLPATAVEELVGAPAGSEVIAYCHSGGRSAMAVEVLRSAGYEARNYPGSWHEWAADDALPIEPRLP
jgi:3-mercaptopyruvate sulfurtransferase SseA